MGMCAKDSRRQRTVWMHLLGFWCVTNAARGCVTPCERRSAALAPSPNTTLSPRTTPRVTRAGSRSKASTPRGDSVGVSGSAARCVATALLMLTEVSSAGENGDVDDGDDDGDDGGDDDGDDGGDDDGDDDGDGDGDGDDEGDCDDERLR
eukprot:5046053-Pleurochrysis_carterae.AAC.1